MIGIPFHSEAGCPSGTTAATVSGVPVSGNGGFVEATVETAVNINVGIAAGLGCMGLEQAVKTSIRKSKLAAMGFFTKPSLFMAESYFAPVLSGRDTAQGMELEQSLICS
jgi:hypothetical protein